MAITQHNRALRIEASPLAQDELLLSAFRGREGLSDLFSFQLDLLSQTGDIAPRDIVGEAVTFSLLLSDGNRRYFNGVVRRFSRGPTMGNSGLRHYRAELVPWMWFLTRNSNCRIFAKQSAQDILETIFKDHGFGHAARFQLSGPPTKREYCVQYRETDFSFASRLMEEEGFFYYFQHSSGKHELVVADAPTAYKDCPEANIEYFPGDKASDRVTRWDHNYEFRSGKWSQNDYNFETPTNKLASESKTIGGMRGSDKFTLYDYPGGYAEKPAGDALARFRMEQEEVAGDTTTAESTCRTLHPAGRFKLKSKEDSPQDHDKQFAIISIEHSASDSSYEQGNSGEFKYGNLFSCIPAKVAFRPARTTPKPTVQGLESAVVVGPDKDTPHTDKFGRIKVKFHWDREDKSESCWIRTSQVWAGSGWGALFLPRVGQEVMVSFLGGDPDRPIITGCVYNAEQKPPYNLPDAANQSGIKSRSWPNGSSDTFNELRFDDKNNEESVYFQAQKDFKRLVKHDDSLEVQNDRTTTIKKNLTSIISEGDESHTLKQGNRTVSLHQGNDTLKLSKGDYKLELAMGNAVTKLTTGKASTEAMQGIELKVEANRISIIPGLINAQATQGIMLKVGNNSIMIDEAGITIKGVQVKIEADAAVEVKGEATCQISASGPLALKGAIVEIN